MSESPSQLNKIESELVEQAKTDEQAFAKLYDQYFGKIYAFVVKRVSHQETAEDIVSETFMKVFLNLSKYESRGYTFGAWLYKIAGNLVIDHYRKHGREKTAELEPEIYENLAGETNLEKDVNNQQLRQLLNSVLNKLPEQEREVIELKFFAQMSNQEISVATSLSANHVGVIVYRGLKKLSKNKNLIN